MATKNLRVTSFQLIASPAEFIKKFPLTKKALETVIRGRENIENVLDFKDPRKIIIAGPCSIHDIRVATEYAKRLNELRKKVDDKFIVVMRTYLEKPRTTVGWKGFLYDPFLDGSYNLNEGVKRSRQLLIAINDLDLPVAAEVLGPMVIQYYSDLISWGVIGARTSESQTHRELASGLSVPIGFKNGTEGNVDIAVNAILSTRTEHSFLGMNEDGKVAIVHTTGNPYGHLVLRGGKRGSNFDPLSIHEVEQCFVQAGLEAKCIIDCSHDNSEKNYRNQGKAWHALWEQVRAGSRSICGAMLESNLLEGSQKLTGKPKDLEYGVSITDSCIGFEETERLILNVYSK